MPLELGTFDKNEASAIVAIQLSDPIPFMEIQFGKTPMKDVRTYLLKEHAHSLAIPKKGKWQGNITHAKVVDRVGDKASPIAWAEWEEYKYTLEADYSSKGAPPDLNHAFRAAVHASSKRMYEKFLQGEKNYMLSQLFTLPEHRRRGAATMLLADTFAKADAEGAICFLEVGGDSKEFQWYKKMGFREPRDKEARTEILWTLGEDSGVYQHVAMIRQPGGADI